MGEKEIKEAFEKIKEDILFLSQELIELKEEIISLNSKISLISLNTTKEQQIQHKSSTNSSIYQGNKPYFDDYKGNDGVPTDSQQIFGRQNKQLNRTLKNNLEDTNYLNISEKEEKLKILNEVLNIINSLNIPSDNTKNQENFKEKLDTDPNKEVSNLLNEKINILKQEFKEKFKKLTQQEFMIFSSLYSLEEQTNQVTYKDLAINTGLTESSIRDYISKLIVKGIPILKERINNKLVLLKIAPELKNLTTLEALYNITSYK